MKEVRSLFVGALFGGIFIFGLHLLHAQETANNLSAQQVNALSDEQVLLQAVEALPAIPADSAPRAGTFWSAQHAPGSGEPWPPLPSNIRQVPLWNLGGDVFLMADQTIDYSMPPSSPSSMLMAGGMLMASDVPSPGGDGGGSGGSDPGFYSESFNYTLPTNGLWLTISNVSGGLAYLDLHGATNFVYEIFSRTNLADASGWNIETEVFPTDTNAMPFTIPVLDRTDSLFVWTRDWTGITSLGNQAPEWWLWKYFETAALSDTNLDILGNTFRYDYQHGHDPNIINFLLSFPNQFVNNSMVTGKVTIFGGLPFYYAVLVDSTNFSGATWIAYNASEIPAYLGTAEGSHDVWIGLRGLPLGAQQTWQKGQVVLDTMPPVITVTNPAAGTAAQPFIQVQGFANENLSGLTFDVSNAAGIFTNQTGFVTGKFFDTNALAFTTNYFQCYDVALTNGLNIISLHAMDLAGNATTANVSVTLDYSGVVNPPASTLVWPPAGTPVGGTNFTLQAQVNDPTATVTVTVVDASGNTNTVAGVVNRNGQVSVSNIPVGGGVNNVTLTVTDAAGNSSNTTFTVTGNDVGLTMNPLSDAQLGQTPVSVGGSIGEGNYSITVNGVAATISGDPTWAADNVPVNPTGTAVINVNVYSNGTLVAAQAFYQPQPAVVSVTSYQAHLGTEPYVDIGGSCGLVMWDIETVDWNSSDGGEDIVDQAWHNYNCVQHLVYDVEDLTTNDFDWDWEYAETRDTAGWEFGIPFWQFNHMRTAVALQTEDPGAMGSEGLYLVRASAVEPVEYNYYSRQPLPPEWLQVRGQTLINSGITNGDDGAVWGDMIFQFPAGAQPDVTPVATQVYSNWWDYMFDVRANEINLQLGVDANRDGGIAFDAPNGQPGPDHTTAGQPYRFWVNDDEDADNGDIVPVAARDCDDYIINSPRDLEDLTRLWINTQGISEQIKNGEFLIGLKWKNITGSPSINIFQAVETNGGTLYLTDTNLAQQQAWLDVSHRRQTVLNNGNDYHQVDTSGTFLINSNFWQAENVGSNNPVAHLLFEGCAVGKGQLIVTINKQDGTELAEAGGVWLDIKDIKAMYQRAAATPSSDSFAPPYVTDSQEAMAFVARPRSKAVGALEGVSGPIDSEVDLNANFGFDTARQDHSAEFDWNIQQLGDFYLILGQKLRVFPEN